MKFRVLRSVSVSCRKEQNIPMPKCRHIRRIALQTQVSDDGQNREHYAQAEHTVERLQSIRAYASVHAFVGADGPCVRLVLWNQSALKAKARWIIDRCSFQTSWKRPVTRAASVRSTVKNIVVPLGCRMRKHCAHGNRGVALQFRAKPCA